MNGVGVLSLGQQSLKPASRMRDGWRALALAGASAFWLANLAISATPVAAGYRSALSIPYVPMLIAAAAAAGGLVLSSASASRIVHDPAKIPGSGPLTRTVLLGTVALVLLTIGLALPAKLSSGVDDPTRWLIVATVFNVIRVLALAVTIGLVMGRTPTAQPSPRVEKEGDEEVTTVIASSVARSLGRSAARAA